MEPLGYLADEPFGQEAARVLCSIPGLFEVGRVYRRKDITTELKSAFGQYGGKQVPLIGKIAAVFKSWGRTDRPFKQVASGRYEFLGYGEQLDNLTHSPAPDAQGSSPLDSDSVMPDWEFGSGPYEVYAWFLPQYQESPDNRWPIKIGRTGIEGFQRRVRDFSENLPERPHYLLRICCTNEREARQSESLLHACFERRGQKIEGLPGNEWFRTNPDEVKEVVQTLMFPSAQL